VASAFSRAGGGGSEEPVAADLLKALGEDMLEEARDEAVDGQCEAFGLMCAGIDVAEGDAVVFEGFDAVVGQRDATDVAGEILGGVLAVSRELRLNVPGLAEDRRIDLIEQPRPVEGVADLGAEDSGECVSREQEAAVGGFAPSFAAFGQSARGDEEMDMGVVGEVASPGVKHGQDTEGGADPLRIVCEELESRCGLAQEQVVDDALVGPREGSQLGGEGEGEKVVGTRQEALVQPFEPELCGAVVALRAVAVAAGMVGEVEVSAIVAAEHRASENRSPAGKDVRHRPGVRGQHAGAKGLSIGGPGAAEDFRQLDHGGNPWRSAALHQPVDGVSCGVANLPGEVGVDGSSAGAGVAEVLLDQSQVDTILEQMGGVGVAQGVDVGALVDAALFHGVAEGTLEAVAGDRSAIVSDGVLNTMAGGGRKQPEWAFMGAPMIAQQLKGGGGKWDLAVLAALAADAQNAPGTVDIGNLEIGAFHEAQAAGVDGGQANAVDVDADDVEDAPDLLATENDGERLVVARLGDMQALPVAAECLVVEEPDAAENDREAATGNLLLDGQMQKVAADFVFLQLIRSPMVVSSQLGHGVDVALDRAWGVAPKLHPFGHLSA